MSKKKRTTSSVATKQMRKFRFVAKDGRGAETILAGSLKEAVNLYNNPTQNV